MRSFERKYSGTTKGQFQGGSFDQNMHLFIQYFFPFYEFIQLAIYWYDKINLSPTKMLVGRRMVQPWDN